MDDPADDLVVLSLLVLKNLAHELEVLVADVALVELEPQMEAGDVALQDSLASELLRAVVRAPEPLQLLVLDLGHVLVSLHVACQHRRELEFCVALVARLVTFRTNVFSSATFGQTRHGEDETTPLR
jgi:hypothetical protein